VTPAGQGWHPAATEVLERACEFFGGEAAWQRLRAVRLFAGPLTGLLPLVKGHGRTFRFPAVMEVRPHEGRTRFLDYPQAGSIGVYDNGAVRIERESDGEILESSPGHRATFRGLAKNRFWTPLDALYFFGYAVVHYHSLPFSLASARLVSSRRVPSRGAPLDVLDVELDAERVHTHSRRESFWFDASGCLVRHDYVADVIGTWARGAHFWQDVTRTDGYPLAMERRVVPRLGDRPLPVVTVLHATFHRAEVETTR
jgi:hypothetical protein